MLDRWLQTGPWMFLLFLLLGVGAGFWNLIKAVNAEAAAARARAAEVQDLEQGRE
jgi:F0F1-type ATP synthase assembly protein I